MGRVCSIHEVWCPDGACKWCEAPEGLSDEGGSAVEIAIAAGLPTMWAATLPAEFVSATLIVPSPGLSGYFKGYSAPITVTPPPAIRPLGDIWAEYEAMERQRRANVVGNVFGGPQPNTSQPEKP